MWFFLNLYLQQVLGLRRFEGGAALLPMTAAKRPEEYSGHAPRRMPMAA